MRAQRWGWIVVLAVTASGCNRGGDLLIMNGVTVYEKYWYEAVDDLRPRASYELACPREQLGFALIQRGQQLPTHIAVAGCGRNALYQRREGRGRNHPWFIVSMTPPPLPQYAPPPLAQPPSQPR